MAAGPKGYGAIGSRRVRLSRLLPLADTSFVVEPDRRLPNVEAWSVLLLASSVKSNVEELPINRIGCDLMDEEADEVEEVDGRRARGRCSIAVCHDALLSALSRVRSQSIKSRCDTDVEEGEGEDGEETADGSAAFGSDEPL